MKGTVKLYARFLLLGCALFLFESQSFAVDPIVGTWTGAVDTPDGSQTVMITMTLTSATEGTIDYPETGCGGTLSGSGSGGVYNFTETTTHANCMNGVSIRVVLQGDNMSLEWSASINSKDFYMSGNLARSKPAPVTKTCLECGEALMNDVYFGLQNSQNLKNYVNQARQNYSNCIRDIEDKCKNTCGRRFFDILPGCEQWDGEAYKAAVERTLKGARLSCQ